MNAPLAALVTASYAPDFERCRLLCESVDAHVTGVAQHYLLVAHHDVALFRRLEGPGRTVIDERDILPPWLHSLRDPASLFSRRIWLSLRTKPLRGWHVQQLRRIALARAVEDRALVYVDSDVAFVRPFDGRSLWRHGALPLLRRDQVLTDGEVRHREWSVNAAVALGLGAEPTPYDYIATLIAWDRDSVRAMCDRIEAVHGRHWVEVVASRRQFSECMLYGRYVDDILKGQGHYRTASELCRIYWSGPEMTEAGLRGFINGMAPYQVAIGIQSFTGTDIRRIRSALNL